MLSNAYFLAKVRFDTAENEPAKKLQILQMFLKSENKCLESPAHSPDQDAGPPFAGSHWDCCFRYVRVLRGQCGRHRQRPRRNEGVRVAIQA